MTPTKADPRIEIAQLQLSVQHLGTLVERQIEVMDGTARTPGLREKITIAQYNIEANKQAYQAVMDEVKKVEERIGKSLVELNVNIQKQITAGFEAMKVESTSLREADKTTATTLQKIQPWINGIAWALTLAGAALIGALVTGKLRLAP